MARSRTATFTAAQNRSDGDATAEIARLRAKLVERDRLLAEARAREAAMADVARAVADSPARVQPVLDAVAEHAARLCDADDAQLWLVDEGDFSRLAASFGSIPGRALGYRVGGARNTESALGRALAERRPVHLPDFLAAADEYPRHRLARELGIRTMLVVPLLTSEGELGVIQIRRLVVQPFSDEQVRLLETFASQAATAIRQTGLVAELQASNRTLAEALEQQTATSEILRVISGSPTDVRPVFDAILRTVLLLSDAKGVFIYLRQEDRLRIVAGQRPGQQPAHADDIDVATAAPHLRQQLAGQLLDRGWAAARAVLEARTVYLPDIASPAGDEYPISRQNALESGWQALLAVPLLQQGLAVGVISLSLDRTRGCTPRQIALCETFAAQAAIAIENTRLFKELQQRDDRRARELERASAIQQRLLPSDVEGWPGLLEVAVRFRPAVETSGDFYDVLPLTPARSGDLPPLQIAVGDVAGKGMSAALVTALARSALRSTTAMPMQMATPANTLRLAGSRLYQDVGSSHFVACALAVAEPPGLHNTGPLLRLSNAAQVPVLLIRNGSATELEAPGYRLPLGAQADGAYRDVEVELRSGDVVVFSSDGLVEAPRVGIGGWGLGNGSPPAPNTQHLTPPSSPGELFGFERLAQSAGFWAANQTTADAVAEGIWRDVTAWAGAESHHDDMTLLVVRVP